MDPKEIPAFPCTEDHGLNSGLPGMTLRDYFAAKAMQGMALIATSDDGMLMGWADMAKAAYLAADAMLKARGQP